MSFCEDDCEISSTLACTSAVVEKVRPTTSGTPTIPGPPTVMSATSRIAVSAFTPPPLLRPLRRDLRARSLRARSCCESRRECRPATPRAASSDAALWRRSRRARWLRDRKFREWCALRHQPRVGGEHAVHVGPDDDFIRVESRAENRRRIVRAAAPERRQNTVLGRADRIPSTTGITPPWSSGRRRALRAFARPVHQRIGAAVVRIRHDQLRSLQPLRCALLIRRARPPPSARKGVRRGSKSNRACAA